MVRNRRGLMLRCFWLMPAVANGLHSIRHLMSRPTTTCERSFGLVKERAEGKPVAYLVGHREFYSMRFQVTRDVLIPRRRPSCSSCGCWTSPNSAGNSEPITIADIGVGSGIIAVVAAKRLPHARIAAIDSSQPALDVATSNAAAHGVGDRIEWVRSDLFADVPVDCRFDIIASNPPYISEPEFQQLSKTVKDYEPHRALVAGPKGTEVIERLIPQAAERLNAGGWLLIEVSPMIEQRARALIEADSRFTIESTIKDLAGQPRVVQARKL